jgi:hypothetical protein
VAFDGDRLGDLLYRWKWSTFMFRNRASVWAIGEGTVIDHAGKAARGQSEVSLISAATQSRSA